MYMYICCTMHMYILLLLSAICQLRVSIERVLHSVIFVAYIRTS